MKWFNLFYMVITCVLFAPIAAIGWLAAEVCMAFRAGFNWCLEYNQHTTTNVRKNFGD